MRRTAAAVLLAVSTLAAVAGAVGVPAVANAAAETRDEVHIGPAPATPGAAAGGGYFGVTIAPGDSAAERLLVANPAAVPCRVALSAAVGRTALNSGDTYVTASGTWVRSVPAVVRVGAGQRVVVPFEVRVPGSARAGQYLYGVVGSPAAGAAGAAGSGVSLHVTSRVAIGVAVTVPGAAVARVQVSDVTSTPEGTGVSIRLVERNSGTTWEHPRGAVTITLPDRTLRIPVSSNTLLAGGEATLAVAADDVPAGTYPVEVALGYGRAQAANWAGRLAFAPPSVVRHGDELTVTTDVPQWAYWGLGVLGALLAVALAAVALLWRRGRARAASA